MKIWILIIFRLASALEKYIDEMGKRIEKIAVNPFGVTIKQYEKILEISDQRVKMINLRAMYDLMLKRLDGEQVFLIAKYAFGLSARVIGERLGVNGSTAYKRLIKAIDTAADILAEAGFDEARMEKEYCDMPAVMTAYAVLKSKARNCMELKKSSLIPTSIVG